MRNVCIISHSKFTTCVFMYTHEPLGRPVSLNSNATRHDLYFTVVTIFHPVRHTSTSTVQTILGKMQYTADGVPKRKSNKKSNDRTVVVLLVFQLTDSFATSPIRKPVQSLLEFCYQCSYETTVLVTQTPDLVLWDIAWKIMQVNHVVEKYTSLHFLFRF